MENNIKCPYCTEEINSKASICKHCKKNIEGKLREIEKERLKQEKYQKRSKVFGGKVLNHLEEYKWVYIILFSGVIYSHIAGSGNQSLDIPDNIGICNSEVKKAIAEDYYKNPATVNFESCVWKKDENTGITKISGKVDSQNGFGAIIRSEIFCEIGKETKCKITEK